MSQRTRCWCAIAVVWLMCVLPARAQAPEASPSRARVGAALEGGGALGLAHIGVLQWLEEHHIPIDYVAGTSMGGLVGGVYAMGMTPAEIRKLISNIDWDAVLRGQLEYRDLAYRRKQDREDFQNSLQFGLRGGLSLPGGLNTGREITYIFDRASLPYSDLKSFDELPIPFRCVATDLSNGKAYVFKDGPLGDALRSTMSLPAIFTPIKRGDSLYADGGLLDNLPVDVVKQMGANVVVAINLGSSSFDVRQKQNMLSVMDRSITLMIMANELRSMEKADLVITVDLNGFSSTDYKSADKIIDRGYAAAARKSAMLSALAVDEESWKAYLANRNSRKRLSMPVPVRVEVKGPGETLSRDLERALSPNVGKPLDTKLLEKDLNLISGVGRFSRLSYGMAETDGASTLTITAEQHDYAPPFLNLGVFVDGSDYNDVRFTFNGRITALDVAGYRSEWRTDFSLGSIWALGSELYKPVSAGSRWFVAPRVFASDRPLDLYDRSEQIADYRIREYGAGFDVGYAINRFSEVRAGYETGDFRSALSIGSPLLPTPSGRIGASSLKFNLDTLDSPIVPRRGQALRWRMNWYDAMPGARNAFAASDIYFATVHPISRPASVYVQAYGGTTFGEQATGLPLFFLGGPWRLGAYGENEIRTNQYFLTRIGYLHELWTLPPMIGRKVYFTSAYEVAKAYGVPSGARLPSSLPMDAAIGLVTDTFIGPIGIGASVGDTGHRKWYFQIGRLF